VTCVFCEKVADGSAKRLGFNIGVATFEPLNPVTEGHRLFIPIQHYESALDTEDQNYRPAGMVLTAAAWWAKTHGIEDCNFITSVGPAATQSVFHYHLHLIPRREGDGLLLPWSNQRRTYQPIAFPQTDASIRDEEESLRPISDAAAQALGALSFTCPVCRKTSHNLFDAEYGYCGHCRSFTRNR
jgi:histidine triad (HIT) family protein